MEGRNGEVLEWSNRRVWKARRGLKPLVGSNPTLSATQPPPPPALGRPRYPLRYRPGHRVIVTTFAVCYDSSAMTDAKHWVALSLIPNLGAVRFRLLEDHFRSLEAAWTASLGELKAAGVDDKTARAIVTHRADISPDGEMEKLQKAGVRALTWNDSSYPPRLKEIHDPPPVLYVLGEILPEDERAVAVVGTRKATSYGREAAATLSRSLAGSGVTIVSGLARGIDSVAHRAALEGEGRTIAVFGCGLDVIYPPEHRKLARDILDHGALVSEHPLGTKPDARHFPRRNRLISGMTLGTLVVEAGEVSGALLTVRQAPGAEPRGLLCAGEHLLTRQQGHQRPYPGGRQAGHGPHRHLGGAEPDGGLPPDRDEGDAAPGGRQRVRAPGPPEP